MKRKIEVMTCGVTENTSTGMGKWLMGKIFTDIIIKRRKAKWIRHILKHKGLLELTLEGSVEGASPSYVCILIIRQA